MIRRWLARRQNLAYRIDIHYPPHMRDAAERAAFREWCHATALNIQRLCEP